MSRRLRTTGAAAIVALTAAPAIAQCEFDSGSDGTDGPLIVTESTVIDLSLAATGSWDTPGVGSGVYDPDLWVVVFKYSDVSIAPGTTVSFLNHPSGAPVAWLVQNDALIDGAIELGGQATFNKGPYEYTTPGPGGFAGGAYGSAEDAPFPRGAGFGPGGGLEVTQGGAYLGTYGNESVFPLIGGSGGHGDIPFVGAAGGGAILIAANGTIDFAGAINARGGNGKVGAGSGGGIRLIAHTIVGTGAVIATGGSGFHGATPGRIRIEACDHEGYVGPADPAETRGAPGQVLQDVLTPTLTITHVNGIEVPADPKAGVLTKDVVTDSATITLEIAATNIPDGTIVTVVVAPAHGSGFTVESTPLADGTATANFMLESSFGVDVQLRASW